MNRLIHILHKGIFALVSNVGCYAFAAFITTALIHMDPILFSGDGVAYFQRNVLIPWGIALCLLRVCRLAAEKERRIGADVLVLMLLWGWITVPFALRFGWEKNTWISNLIVFMGIYATAVEAGEADRERYLNTMTGLMAVLGWAMGTTLMYCLLTVTTFTVPYGHYGYGIWLDKFLVSGHYYNTTGIIALCTGLMCLCGTIRARKTAMRIAYVVPFAMMTVVVVLTQSRTSRYALLAALALSAYGIVQSALSGRKWPVRQTAAICVAAAVLVGGFIGADRLTEAALYHIQRVRIEGVNTAMEKIVPAAIAEETKESAAPGEAELAEKNAQKLKRGVGEFSFTGRTRFWKNILRFWKENPKYMLIGYGAGRTGMILAEGTSFAKIGGVDAHNTYFQIAMEYGLIGVALYVAFALLLLRPILRLFFKGEWRSGYGVLFALVAAVLLIGMMESEPLISMSISNIPLFFSLAILAAKGREAN